MVVRPADDPNGLARLMQIKLDLSCLGEQAPPGYDLGAHAWARTWSSYSDAGAPLLSWRIRSTRPSSTTHCLHCAVANPKQKCDGRPLIWTVPKYV